MPRKPKTAASADEQPSLFDGIVSSDPAHAGIPGVALEVTPEDAAMLGAFEEDALSFEDVMECQDAPEVTPSTPEEAHRQRIEQLREHHRVLSELIIEVNRSIARIAIKTRDLETDEARELLARLRSLQEQRAAIEAETQEEVKALKALERRLANVPGGDGKGGLVKVRHPNRDFFLADLFDYAMKDDGASMEAPIFTLSTKPDQLAAAGQKPTLEAIRQITGGSYLTPRKRHCSRHQDREWRQRGKWPQLEALVWTQEWVALSPGCRRARFLPKSDQRPHSLCCMP